MAGGEKLKATFFTLQKRDRAVLAPATVTIALIFAVCIGAYLALNWNGLSAVMTFAPSMIDGSAKPDERMALRFISAMFGLVGGAFLLALPLSIAWAAYEAACLRWMIRREAPGLFGLTINNDTWRVYGVYWCWIAAQMAVGTVVSMVTMPFMFAALPEIAQAKTLPDMWIAQMRIQAPTLVLQYGAMIFLGVRFSPAAAIAVARRQFAFITAWDVTRGRFWELFGSFAIIWLTIGALSLVAAAIIVGPLIVTELFPRVTAVLANPRDPAALSAYLRAFLSPHAVLLIAINHVIFALFTLARLLLQFGVNARTALVALEEGKIAAPTA